MAATRSTTMKQVLLSAALLLSFSGSLALAQAPAATPPAPTGKYHHGHRPHDPQSQAAFLSKKLNLSADQTAKLEPILADRQQKIAALKSNTALSPEERKQQMRTIHQDTKQQLSTVLTPDQLQQMKSLRHGGHGPHNHGEPQSTPQSSAPSGL
jgi:Spy/CpxP family protein refolding chaperone